MSEVRRPLVKVLTHVIVMLIQDIYQCLYCPIPIHHKL